MNGLKLLYRGFLKMPLFWQAWVFILIIINGLIPLFFLSEPVAIVVITAFFIGGLIGMVLVEVQGFTKLLGLMHAPWVPVLALQLLVVPQAYPQGNFEFWLLASIIVSTISLVIDTIDITKYMNGHKTDLLKA